jgi:hypothetical protein
MYQCYAPEEVSDVAKAASAMKRKGARDLRKLVKYEDVLKDILQTTTIKRWILLCPFLDDKEVVSYVREKGTKLKTEDLAFIGPDFEALVQSQADFTAELEQLRNSSLGPSLKIEAPTTEQVVATDTGEMNKRLTDKLGRAFPAVDEEELKKRREGYVRAHLIRENALTALKTDHPILWERSIRCLESEERRLETIGSQSSAPSERLRESLDRIESSLGGDLPNLAKSAITDIAVGTVTDWLFRCPLDFPKSKP